MKKTFMRLFSFFLSMILLVLQMPAFVAVSSDYEEETETIKVYFKETKGWEKVYIFGSHSVEFEDGTLSQVYDFGAYPGLRMNYEGVNSKGQAIYSAEVPVYVETISFNEGGNVRPNNSTSPIPKETIFDNAGYFADESDGVKKWSVCSYSFDEEVIPPLKFGDFEYSVENNEVKITAYKGNSSVVTIPAEIDSLPVKTIGKELFQGNLTLEQVVISDGISTIEEYVFGGCTSLVSAQIPSSVTSIGKQAFIGCENLTEVEIPENLTVIEDQIFAYCKSIQSIRIPEGVTKIGTCAFESCVSLTEVVIPDTVEFLGCEAFYCCYSLEKVKLPSSLETFEPGVFMLCNALRSVTIPKGYEEIPDMTFYSCPELTEITIPESVKKIGNCAFQDSTEISDVYFGGTILQWRDIEFASRNEELLDAELHCDKIVEGVLENGLVYSEYIGGEICITGFNGSQEKVVIPSEIQGLPVTEIVDCVFMNKKNLVCVVIPEGVRKIGYCAFENCTNLEIINIPSTVECIMRGSDYYDAGAWYNRAFNNTAYFNNEANWEDGLLYIDSALIAAREDIRGYRKIKEGTTLISDWAFFNCTDLTYLDIPSSVTHIGDYAFASCDLPSLYIPKTVESIRCAFHHFFSLICFEGTKEEWNQIFSKEVCEDCWVQVTFNASRLEPKTYILGDTNLNGRVNIVDATLIQKAVAGIVTLSEDSVFSADTNLDKKVNIRDATHIQKYLVDIETDCHIGEIFMR